MKEKMHLKSALLFKALTEVKNHFFLSYVIAILFGGISIQL